MKVKPFSCHSLVILVIVVILLGGCRRSPTPRYYSLSPMQDQAVSKRSSPVHNAIIGIGPVKLADYLDQPRLVNRRSDNQLTVAEHDRCKEERHLREAKHLERRDQEHDDEEPLHQHAEECAR